MVCFEELQNFAITAHVQNKKLISRNLSHIHAHTYIYIRIYKYYIDADNRLVSLGGCCCRVHNTTIGGSCIAAGSMDGLITGDEACSYDEIVTTVETDDELEHCDWPDYENTVVVGGHKRGKHQLDCFKNGFTKL